MTSIPKQFFLIAGLFSLGSSAIAADASPAAQLAKARNCMTCHQVDSKILGPAFKDIAARYRGKSESEALLVQRVMHGSRDIWSATPMPSNNQVTEEEARTLVKWILSK